MLIKKGWKNNNDKGGYFMVEIGYFMVEADNQENSIISKSNICS